MSLNKTMTPVEVNFDNYNKLLEEKAKEKSAKSKQDMYGKDTFIKLLVAQMKYQNPLEPLKNEEFLAQMAQFSSVEQIAKLSTSFEGFVQKFDKIFSEPKDNKDVNKEKSQDNKEKDKKIDETKNTLEVANNENKKVEKQNDDSNIKELLKEYSDTNKKLLERIDYLLYEIRELKKG